MDLNTRLAVLDRLYAIHDRFRESFGPFACRAGCAACCTGNVTATTLEVYRLVEALPPEGARALWEAVDACEGRRRFRPTLTLNAVAERMLKGEPEPDEGGDPDWGACPALADALCPVYELRPFGCRSFFSTVDCRREGVAEVPPELVTFNTVLIQTIEHVDRPGCTGNLSDLLGFFRSRENRERYRGGLPVCGAAGLLANRATPVLMVPPEHRRALGPVLAAIASLRVPGPG
jgi:hypothetical protein